MAVVRAVPMDDGTGKMKAGLLPAEAATTTALATVSTTATTAATNASTALSTATTAASDAAAAVAAAAGKVPSTGTKTVAGPTDFTTLPTVSAVPVATTDDLDDYIPTTQAATFDLTGYNTSTDTGDVVITAGGKAFTFTYLAGVLQGGLGGAAPVDYEDVVVLRYDETTIPTGTPATDWWPSAKPSSGGPIVQYEAVASSSAYVADAFATGKHGLKIDNDRATILLPTSQTPAPGTGRGLWLMSMQDLRMDGIAATPVTDPSGQYLAQFCDAGTFFKFGVQLSYTGGAWKWRINDASDADVVLATATQTFAASGDAGIPGKLVIAIVMRGASSELIIASADGQQTIPFDASALAAYQFVRLTTLESGTFRGRRTHRRVLWGPSDWTADQVDQAIADAADDIDLVVP